MNRSPQLSIWTALFVMAPLFSTTVLAQGVAEVWTDKTAYESGETIVLTLKVTNPDSQTYVWETPCNEPTIVFDGIDIGYPACILMVQPLTFPPQSWRTWTFTLRPPDIGLPAFEGTHRLAAKFAHLTDSVDVNAAQFVGGRVDVFIADSANADSLASFKLALGADVLDSHETIGGQDEVWQIQNATVADAIARFSRDGISITPRRHLLDVTSIATEKPELPDLQMQVDAYPNPFSESVTIRVTPPDAGRVVVEVFDTLGRRVAVLYDGALPAGLEHRFDFAPTGVAKGQYLYRVTGSSSMRAGMVTYTGR